MDVKKRRRLITALSLSVTAALAAGGIAFLGGTAGAEETVSGGPEAGAPPAETVAASLRHHRWPGPHNTGVPRGVRLRTYTGPMEITRDGTVIDRKHIKGCLQIKAKRVKIKRSKISCGSTGSGETFEPGYALLVFSEGVGPNGEILGPNVVVEDSEIDGLGTGYTVAYDNYTLRRVNVHNMDEGPRLGDNVVIEDSWIHDLKLANPENHRDTLQTTGGTNQLIRNNYVDATSADPNVLHNAALMVGAEGWPLTNLKVERNLFSGGGYAINIREDQNMTNVVFKRNVFKRNSEYGAVRCGNWPLVTFESSNVWYDTGEPVPQHYPDTHPCEIP